MTAYYLILYSLPGIFGHHLSPGALCEYVDTELGWVELSLQKKIAPLKKLSVH